MAGYVLVRSFLDLNRYGHRQRTRTSYAHARTALSPSRHVAQPVSPRLVSSRLVLCFAHSRRNR